MLSRFMIWACTLSLAALVASSATQAFESSFANLPEMGTGSGDPHVFESTDSDLIFEITSFLPSATIGAGNVTATAHQVGNQVSLPVTAIDDADTAVGSTAYLNIDASDLCDPGRAGEPWAVVAHFGDEDAQWTRASSWVQCGD